MLKDETYAKKRKQFSADELKSYQGQWVAVSIDGGCDPRLAISIVPEDNRGRASTRRLAGNCCLYDPQEILDRLAVLDDSSQYGSRHSSQARTGSAS